MTHDPVIIALDFDSPSDANRLVTSLGDSASFYKVGMELFAAAGMDYVKSLTDRGKRVFLDMKYYDIGEQVKRAVSVVARSGVTLLTIHSVGQVMRAAVEGRGESDLKLIAVTVLTSFDQTDMAEAGYNLPISDIVSQRVQLAMKCGVDGVVASPLEARTIRNSVGPDALIVTPGVRSAGAAVGDQKRVATPAQAVRDGADYIVIGRQVSRAADPPKALAEIHAELEAIVAVKI